MNEAWTRSRHKLRREYASDTKLVLEPVGLHNQVTARSTKNARIAQQDPHLLSDYTIYSRSHIKQIPMNLPNIS
jgi:hypothetical protein